ncbi:MAG: phosphatidylglycerophosphate synthase [Rhodothermales bacterium]|jgi:phosphatidylglycerophosphate synthase
MNLETTIDRRPMAARDHRLFVRSAAALARAGVTPNSISIIGMLLGITGGLLLAATAGDVGVLNRRLLFLGAGLLIPLRGICNILDGVVAVNCNQQSPAGELFNEAPDRISDAAMLIGAGYAASSSPTLGLLAAVLAIFVAYVRAMTKSAGAPQDFCGPMAKPVRIALTTATCILIAFLPALDPSCMKAVLTLICVGCVVTAIRRLRHAAKHLNQG